jgi:hypothetical protein
MLHEAKYLNIKISVYELNVSFITVQKKDCSGKHTGAYYPAIRTTAGDF